MREQIKGVLDYVVHAEPLPKYLIEAAQAKLFLQCRRRFQHSQKLMWVDSVESQFAVFARW